ncbi:flagellar filament capping protein FliD [Zemynaea arenosa]|nr:flagellar filament capping protein FliD [Massilia arenosa]
MAGTISSSGIGSNLPVDDIISKLMAVEAQPLTQMAAKVTALQTKVKAFGTLTSAVSSFQAALSGLTKAASFQSLTALSTNTDVLVGSASAKAVPGNYSINVNQIAQAQTLTSGGRSSLTAAIGGGAATRITFQFGAASGNFGVLAGALPASVATGGITPGALTLNGTVIDTDATTTDPAKLVNAINAKATTTGVNAAQVATSSATLFGSGGASTFGAVDTSGTGTYALTVGGVEIAAQADGIAAGAGVTAASIDDALANDATLQANLNAAGISFTGKAADGTLRFTRKDGTGLAIDETVTGAVQGGIGTDSATVNSGSSVTAAASLTLLSQSGAPIVIGGSNPSLAGLTAGSAGSFLDAAFSQDNTRISGSVVIDATNNNLQGIRDAINKANIGVTATIVSDGSANPYHLVLSSSSTGAKSTMRIVAEGKDGGPVDADVQSLLAYDPAGTQNLTQNTAAQSTKLTVNGIAVTSETTSVSEAIQGVNLTIGTTGKANLNVAKDTAAVKANVTAFVKAYNDLNTAINQATSYDASTKAAGPLLGDASVRNLETSLRRQLGVSITGLENSALTTLSQVGIQFQKDGSLTLDSSKLDKAIADHFDDIAGLFGAVGKATDSLVQFSSSTSKTIPGDYAVNITALARQGSVQSENALAASIVIQPNTSWIVTLNQTDPATANRTQTVQLTAGTYTPEQLATLIQTSINGISAYSSNSLQVNANIDADGKLNLVSTQFGSVSKIAVSSSTGTAVSDIFGSAPVLVDGQDVAGTLGGKPAKGSGQFLTDDFGLKVQITGGATGDRGTVGFSQGYAYQLNNLANSYIGTDGLLGSRTTGLNASIKDIQKQQDRFSDRLTDIEKRYRAQYTALDSLISSMSATQSYLTQQLAALNANSKS